MRYILLFLLCYTNYLHAQKVDSFHVYCVQWELCTRGALRNSEMVKECSAYSISSRQKYAAEIVYNDFKEVLGNKQIEIPIKSINARLYCEFYASKKLVDSFIMDSNYLICRREKMYQANENLVKRMFIPLPSVYPK